MTTKLDMARIIIQALNNDDSLPTITNINVKRLSNKPKHILKELHTKALIIIRQRIDNDQL